MIINDVSWRVRLVSPAHPILFTPWGTHALGVCDKGMQIICIDETLSPYQLKQVLCHEIVHAFMFSYSIDLSYEEEEQIAELISEYGEKIMEKTTILYDSIKQKRGRLW